MEKENSDMDRNETTLINAIKNTYFSHLVQDYADRLTKPSRDTTIEDRMTREFAEGLSFKKGRNYIKIISTRSGGANSTVHSFIVIKPTKGFEIGDILKAAGWAAPATNFKRGNVFDRSSLSSVSWAGCC